MKGSQFCCLKGGSIGRLPLRFVDYACVERALI